MNILSHTIVVASIAALATVLVVSNVKSQVALPPMPLEAHGRYSVQSEMGGMGFSITDNFEQKMYLYRATKTDLELSATIDLSKTGQPNIPVIVAKKPSTQPVN